MIAASSIPFAATFPDGHEHAGAVIGRAATCSRCQREFRQYRVNQAWIDALSIGARTAFLISCEVESNGAAYQPARCPACTRRQLTPEEIPCTSPCSPTS